MTSRDEILMEYFEETYRNYLFNGNNLQSVGINWFERQIEKYFERNIGSLEKVLELGGGRVSIFDFSPVSQQNITP